jgi:hypothetical protein
MNKKNDFRNFCKAVEDIFQKMGGYKTSTTTLKLLFYAAFSNYTILRKTDIPVIRMFKNNLIELLEVSRASLETGILQIADDLKSFSDRTGLPLQSLYFDHTDENASLWDHFPRHLTKDEFLKPSNCIETVFKHKSLLDWKMVVEELFSAALLQQSMLEFSSIIDNAIEIYLDLFKLLETAHIIKVRRPFLDG